MSNLTEQFDRSNARVRRDRITTMPDAALAVMLGHSRVLDGILADHRNTEHEAAAWDERHEPVRFDEAFGS